MSVFKGSPQGLMEQVATLRLERTTAEEPEPTPGPDPIPEPVPEPSPLPDPIPEEVPGRRGPGPEIEDPNGPWVPGPGETPGLPDQPAIPPEVPPTIWPEQGR